MKRIKILPTLILIVIFCFQGVAQIKKANKFFELYQYSKAIPYYLDITQSGSLSEKMEAMQRLADCYRLTNNIEQACVWYGTVVGMDGADPINFYHYGQMLRSAARYEEAAKAYQTFNRLLPDSLYGQKYYEYCIQIEDWLGEKDVAEIKNVWEMNSQYSEFGPVFFNGGLVFSSDRKVEIQDINRYEWTNFGFLNLFYTKPEMPGGYWSAFSEPKIMESGFNQAYHDGPASFTENGDLIYCTKTMAINDGKRDGKIKTDLLKIYWGEVHQGKVQKFSPFFLNDESYSVGHPTLSANSNVIIFSSDMPGGFGGTDLYMCTKENDSWSSPVNLGETINTPEDEVFPFLANDTTLFFSSKGHMGYGGLDIYKSVLTGTGWSTPQNLRHPINSSYDDFGIAVTSDRTEGFFSSNRPGGRGADDIYAFRNYEYDVKSKQTSLTGVGYVKEMGSDKPLSNATVFLFSAKKGSVLVLKTNEQARYEAELDYNEIYLVKAMKNGYIFDCTSFRTPSESIDTPFNVSDLHLPRIELNKVFEVENIYYDLDRFSLREEAKRSLDKIVQIMKEYPVCAELSSHTDSRASYQYNMTLSQNRADAAVYYILKQGISPLRLTAKGYGETMPVNQCTDGVACSEEQHQANRRTEFKITAISSDLNAGGDFDPDFFKAGEELNVNVFPNGFFDGCLLKK